uniref:mRNA-decapping enzyme C-terminal domain-containing protein n=1 Tax=Megaselia scalaris TaxID=36166 RepID=T1H0H7_MEGSC
MTSDIEMRMNLAAIKKTDPYAKEIIESSAHVAFYTFNSAINEWEKTDVEGAFFIYSRNAEPFQSIFINNRLNTNSFVEPITGSLELQPQRPFLLYRNERSRIRGFWFYNNTECDRIGDIIKKLIDRCNDRKENKSVNHQVNPPPMVVNNSINTSSSSNNNNNVGGGNGGGNNSHNQDNNSILHLLTKAQENYNSSQRVAANGNNSTPTIEHTQRNPQTPVTPLKWTPVIHRRAKPTPTSDVPLLQRLNSLNPVVSVDQIEKQQRVTTPVSTTGGGGDLLQIHSNSDPFSQFKIGIPQTQNANDVENSPLAKFIGANNLGRPQNIEPQTQRNIAPSKPALMPPTMFAPTAAAASTSVAKEDCGPPLSTTSSGNQTVWDADKMPEPLTQSQLTQAISYLMRNDPGFVRKIHEAYLKSFTDMVSL